MVSKDEALAKIREGMRDLLYTDEATIEDIHQIVNDNYDEYLRELQYKDFHNRKNAIISQLKTLADQYPNSTITIIDNSTGRKIEEKLLEITFSDLEIGFTFKAEL